MRAWIARWMVVLPWVAALAACGPTDRTIGYVTPRVRLFTPDMISDYEHYTSSVGTTGWVDYWPANCSARGFVVQLSHTELPPDPGQRTGRSPAPDEHAAIIAAIRDGMSLVRVADGSAVASTVEEGCIDLSGTRDPGATEPVVSLVPSAPLEPGWYVLRVDLSALAALGFRFAFGDFVRHEGDVAYARVHWGSRPTWSVTSFECDARAGDGCRIAALATEPISAEVQAGGTLQIAYDGVDAGCGPTTAHVFGWFAQCPLPPDGASVEITLTSDAIFDLRGATLAPTVIPFIPELASGAYVPVLVAPDFALDLVRAP